MKELNKILSKHVDASFPRSSEVQVPKKRAFDHPNFITVNLSLRAGDEKRHEVEAIIDTGANAMLVMPEHILTKIEIDAEPDNSMLIIGITDTKPKTVETVQLSIAIGDVEFKATVMILPCIEKVLLGNQILKYFDLTIVEGKASLIPRKGLVANGR